MAKKAKGNVNAQDLLDANASHSGWLKKFRKGSKKDYQDRYCIIHDGHFFYFLRHDSKKEQGHFSLNNYCAQSEEALPSSALKWQFKVLGTHFSPMREYLFAADSQRERDEWLVYINKEISEHYGSTCRQGGDGQEADDSDCEESSERKISQTSSSSIDKMATTETSYVCGRHGLDESKPTSYDRPIAPPRPLHSLPQQKPLADHTYINQPRSRTSLPQQEPAYCHTYVNEPTEVHPYVDQPRTLNSLPQQESPSEHTYVNQPHQEPPSNHTYVNRPRIKQQPTRTRSSGSYMISPDSLKTPPHDHYPSSGSDVMHSRKSYHRPSIEAEEDPYLLMDDVNTQNVPSLQNIRNPADKTSHRSQDEILPRSVFQFNCDNNQASRLLEDKDIEGMYLIRKSERSEKLKVISVWIQGSTTQFYIFMNDGKIFLDDEVEFSNLPELIEYYYLNPLPRTRAYLRKAYQ